VADFKHTGATVTVGEIRTFLNEVEDLLIAMLHVKTNLKLFQLLS